MRHGWNATAFQIVNPGIDHWFPAGREGVIGYVRVSGVRVVAGGPVCDEASLPDILSEWEADATRARERVCYFGVAGRVHSFLGSLASHSVVVLGSQPTWDVQRWAATVDAKASLRAQLHRARNKGISVEEWSAAAAEDHPQLRRCLDYWLSTRGLPPMHFLVEPDTLSRLEGRRVFVAKRAQEVIGFVVASPVPTRNGWLTEQFVRGPGATNGTVELLLDRAARTFAAEGSRYLTMGLVPLSEQNWSPLDYNPLWLRWLMQSTRLMGRLFYNFQGLESFKAKFLPHDWEPIYAITNEPRFSVRSMWAISAAFSGRSPILLVLAGLWRLVVRATHLTRRRPDARGPRSESTASLRFQDHRAQGR